MSLIIPSFLNSVLNDMARLHSVPTSVSLWINNARGELTHDLMHYGHGAIPVDGGSRQHDGRLPSSNMY
jgi:hypothetical protein